MMEDENHASRQSSRIRKLAPKLGATLLDPNTRQHVAQSRLEALENDGVAVDTAEADEDEDAFAGDEDLGFSQKKVPKGPKRKTRQAKALERLGHMKKAPRTFLEILQEANLEALPAHVPSYLRAAVGPPSSGSRRHFCSVCGYSSPYTCPRCGARFCSPHCQIIHNDTRCQKFVA